MQSRAVNGFLASEIDDALRGAVVGKVKLIPRFDILDSENQLLRATTSILSGSVRNRSQDQIKRTLECLIREANITLPDYPVLVIADGPLFYLKLGEASGATASDSSGFARHFTYAGTIGYSEPPVPPNVTDNAAVTLSGGASISITDAAWMDVAQITFAAWIQTAYAGTTRQAIVARDATTAGNRHFVMRLREYGSDTTAAYLSFVLFDAAGVVTDVQTGVKLNDGLPHHVVGSYDGSFISVFIDSVRVAKQAYSVADLTGAADIVVGNLAIGGGNPFNGQIDEVAMYARALTSAEVREHYAQGSGDLAEIDYTRDRLKVYVKVQMNRNGNDGTPWAEFPLGIFLLSAPDRDMVSTGISRQVQGFDQTTVLLQSAVTDRYVIGSGTNYITNVSTLLTAAGLDTTGYQLTATTLTLPAVRSWPLGTTRLQIINDLLAAINYRPFRFTSAGVGVAEPDVLPKNRAVDYTYSTDEFSVMTPDMRYTQNLFDVPNVVVLSNTQPKRNTITSIATNNLLASPTSVIRRGNGVAGAGRVYYVDSNFDAADQTTLDAAAANLLTRLSQPSEVWDFGTLAHPFHEDEDILTLTDNTGRYNFGLSADFMELEWTLSFTDLAVGTMRHVAQRIVPVA